MTLTSLSLDPSVPDVRSSESLDGALAEFYRKGNTLVIGQRPCPDFRSAMTAILALEDAKLPPIAEQISGGLRHRVRVTCEFDRGLWGWMRSSDDSETLSLPAALRRIRDQSKGGLHVLAPLLGMSLGNNVLGACDCVRRQVDGTQAATIRRIVELCGRDRSVRIDMSLEDDS